MKVQKKIAMSAGGAVLVACLALGGLAAANAATTSAPSSAAAKVAAVKKVAAAPSDPTVAATVPAAGAQPTTAVPALPKGPYNWDDFITTLTPDQQKALLWAQQTQLAKYQAAGGPGSDAAVQKFTYNIDALKKALGQ